MLDFELYGGKRGLLEHAKARVQYALGIYGRVRNINWAAVNRLAFVCMGNVCRSPYAGARARLMGVPAVSFGLEAMDGAPADPVASRNALLRGVDLSEHRSAKAHPSSFADNDLVIVFEPGHLAAIWRWRRGDMPVSLLGIWASPVRPHIQDPYGRSDKYFQQCFSVIDVNVAALVSYIASHGAREGVDGSRKAESNSYSKGSRNRTLA
jgi:protein-tyrosine phosphatase